MKSFTKKLVLNCTGIIFISFLAVYFLFNALVGNYIRAEAERELRGGMTDVVYLTTSIYETMWVAYGEDTDASPQFSIRFSDTEPFIRMGQFEIELRQSLETSDIPYMTIISPHRNVIRQPIDGGLILQQTPIPQPPGSNIFSTQPVAFAIEGIVPTIRPLRTQSFVNADAIIINEQNEILSPALEFLPHRQRAEVEFLVEYYLANQAGFTGNQMRRVAGASNSYYVSATRRPMLNGNISILMYTDISSAMDFTTSMNRILGVLLAVSGMLSLLISIAMSAKFKRAIMRLCDHADTIGRGQFTENTSTFNDTEFNQLSKSMNNMSNMLQTYENNQKQFFQNASHELRTPLMSIQGYAEGILGNVFDKEEAARVILSEGQKMTDLVSELLYISRMDSGVETAISTLDIQNLLQECCERVKPIAHQSNKQITIEPLPQQIFINANKEKLERAIINILSNAIRYAKNEVNINCQLTENNLEISIKDDGEGIDPKDESRLFERFYKGEDGNYGLGLAISRDIIKGLKGNITAKNMEAPQTGAVFTVSLPV
ncbi:MAG: HAMP domain-containing histidine kinase [Defluviitaleaceae bacterium]|nr:HAMP domain-containing histidine kinase [Defluviitaleaceae bacterium]